MESQQQALIARAVRLAADLPVRVLVALAQAVASASTPQEARSAVLQVTPQPAQRARIERFWNEWLQAAPGMSGAEAALVLRTAATATRSVREEQVVDLVWTGPVVVGVPMRRTDQALLDVIAGARRELLIVSFAVYKIPAIAAALVQAAQSGVAIRICVEAPEPSGQRMANDTIRALGPAVAAATGVYIWPRERRKSDGDGQTGVLHAKCAVADRSLLFVSSANLTGNALSLNMELGALIRGGSAPNMVVSQFERMIAEGILQKAQ